MAIVPERPTDQNAVGPKQSSHDVRTASATTATKHPLTERCGPQSFTSLWFGLFIVLLGLLLWWKTTTVHRARIPLAEMMQWADGKACQPVLQLKVLFDAGSLPTLEAQHLERETQRALDEIQKGSIHHMKLQLRSQETIAAEDATSHTALVVRLVPGEATSAVLNERSSTLDVTYPSELIPSRHAATSTLSTTIAHQLYHVFAEERSSLKRILSSSPLCSSNRVQQSASASSSPTATPASRSLRYSSTYHLTISLFTANAVPNTWDIQAAIDEYMQPLLDSLRTIHRFTIDTQIQLYATPGVQSHVLEKDHLSSFINHAEWPLSPSIGEAPTIHFIIYAGNQTIGLDSDSGFSQSWLVPQWGGVYLLNLPHAASHVPVALLKKPMLTIGRQLLSLLGMPESGPLLLRVAALMRVRSLDLILRTSSTLGSLARLSRTLHSIPIPYGAADGVAESMNHLELAFAGLGSGNGLLHARIAEDKAEKAFFEKGMVGQLYSPDEHKLVVYLPLFFPLVWLSWGAARSLYRLVKGWREKAPRGLQK